MYPAELIKPMREHLTQVGFEELHTAEAVDALLNKNGTSLIVVNSVCGCAAANARPGAIMSLQNQKNVQSLRAGGNSPKTRLRSSDRNSGGR